MLTIRRRLRRSRVRLLRFGPDSRSLCVMVTRLGEIASANGLLPTGNAACTFGHELSSGLLERNLPAARRRPAHFGVNSMYAVAAAG
jgi:hypothetical protein